MTKLMLVKFWRKFNIFEKNPFKEILKIEPEK